MNIRGFVFYDGTSYELRPLQLFYGQSKGYTDKAANCAIDPMPDAYFQSHIRKSSQSEINMLSGLMT